MVALQILLLIDIVLSIAALTKFVRILNETHLPFIRVITCSIGFVLFHLVYVLISKIFFPEGGWVENSAPFGLAYGPMSYYLIHTYTTQQNPKTREIWHIVPYFIFCITHVVLLFLQVKHPSLTSEIYFRILYGLISISFLIYGIRGWLSLKKSYMQENIALYLLMIILIICLIVIGSLFLNSQLDGYTLSPDGPNELVGFMMYSFVLVLLVFLNLLRKNSFLQPSLQGELSVQSTRSKPDVEPAITSPQQSLRYNKSGVSEIDLDWYEKVLDDFMAVGQPWADPELNLKKVASVLKIPPHHLTQLLNIRKENNFNEYINTMRIEYSCQLLEGKDEDLSIEDVGYLSGFNSKTTFYRWFKRLKGMTPLDYQGKA